MSWLYFANRLIELPLGIVGVAMGTVLVPGTDARAARRRQDADRAAESRGLELAVGLALPATLGLIVLSEPIVRMLFEHGAFTAADTAATAQALMWLALGLPAHVLVKALSPAFFARDDTLTPLLATLKGLAVAIVLAVVLGHLFGADGIAAGIALGAWSNALALIRRGARDIRIFDRRRRAPAAAAHRRRRRWRWAALLWLTARFVPALATARAWPRAGRVSAGLLIAGAIAIYGLLLALFGVRLARGGQRRPAKPRRRLARWARVANDGARKAGNWKADDGNG